MIVEREDINPLWTMRLDGSPVRIFQPRPKINGFPNAMIMSILLEKEYTRIDFRFIHEVHDIKVPTFSISPDIRIITPADRSTYTPEKNYFLIRSENAPIWPKNFKASSVKDELFFTLYFEPIPMYTLELDMVEDDDEEGKVLMNYYEIDLHKGERKWEIKNSDN